eukprot:scaffold155_cov347-Pavlova_lutheri.AAC.90
MEAHPQGLSTEPEPGGLAFSTGPPSLSTPVGGDLRPRRRGRRRGSKQVERPTRRTPASWETKDGRGSNSPGPSEEPPIQKMGDDPDPRTPTMREGNATKNRGRNALSGQLGVGNGKKNRESKVEGGMGPNANVEVEAA